MRDFRFYFFLENKTVTFSFNISGSRYCILISKMYLIKPNPEIGTIKTYIEETAFYKHILRSK